ncbi:50S ribosomal protein L15 [Candidatus Collierbacteria bacterium]|nr:50S ribosomal protein L15 [Candidatus Collierbacteria bacterium]
MLLSNLKKTNTRSAKRIGRGFGSGKGGHTVGRGQKGQKTRGTIPVWFEGGQLPLIRRTPFIKGKRRFNSLKGETIIITLNTLNKFTEGQTVDAVSAVSVLKLHQARVDKRGLKIVATGKLTKALKISLPTTTAAAKAITKAGGSIVANQN